MYLDKPMRDHTLLQAIARVNRPYENEGEEMVKPHGFVLDFVGIFDKLEKALAFAGFCRIGSLIEKLMAWVGGTCWASLARLQNDGSNGAI